MRRARGVAASAALWLALAATGAQAAQSGARQCVPHREAEALALVLAPEMLRQVGVRCTPALPPESLLRRSERLIAKYGAETAGAMPLARRALKKIAGPDAAGLMDSELGPALTIATMAPLLAGEIKVADCPAINRVLTYLEPLPARNAAGLIATLIQLSDKSKVGSRLPICVLGAK